MAPRIIPLRVARGSFGDTDPRPRLADFLRAVTILQLGQLRPGLGDLGIGFADPAFDGRGVKRCEDGASAHFLALVDGNARNAPADAEPQFDLADVDIAMERELAVITASKQPKPARDNRADDQRGQEGEDDETSSIHAVFSERMHSALARMRARRRACMSSPIVSTPRIRHTDARPTRRTRA